MSIRLRTVDAFTDTAFTGNPAAVVILDRMPAEDWMAALAREMNLSETAFVVPEPTADSDYRLRWFTPAVEVDLCGHATLAAAHCLLADGVAGPIRFATRSGVLTVSPTPDTASLQMDFPARPPVAVAEPDGLAAALGASVLWTGRGGTDDLLVLLADEATVAELQPDLVAVADLPARGIIVTAGSADPGSDFVSRFFGPRVGVGEDPVTGSAHTVLGPFWASRLGRTELDGRQLSARGGRMGVTVSGDRVLLTGHAVTVVDGRLSDEAAPVRAEPASASSA